MQPGGVSAPAFKTKAKKLNKVTKAQSNQSKVQTNILPRRFVLQPGTYAPGCPQKHEHKNRACRYATGSPYLK
jgi:hypothetical protein